jgi:hypothetical protein
LKLHPQELNRVMYTMSISILHKDASIGILNNVNAWDVAKTTLEASNPGPSGPSYLNYIHTHCLKRQHEALCVRLFTIIRNEALNSHDTWTVSARSGSSKSIPEKRNIDMEMLSKIFMRETFSSSVCISEIGRGNLRLAISSELFLEISLVPIQEETATDDLDIKLNNEMEINTNEHNVTMWLHRLISNSLCKGQLMLLQQFLASHEARQKSLQEKEEFKNNRDYKSTTMLAAFQPLEDGDHIRLDIPFLSNKTSYGAAHKKDQRLATSKTQASKSATRSIAKSMIDMLRTNIYLYYLKMVISEYKCDSISHTISPVFSPEDCKLSSSADQQNADNDTFDSSPFSAFAQTVRIHIKFHKRLLNIRITLSTDYAIHVESFFDDSLSFRSDKGRLNHLGATDIDTTYRIYIHPINTRFDNLDELVKFLKHEFQNM